MSTIKALPKKVKVGGLTYKIQLTKGLKDPSSGQSLMGMIWATKPLIEIESELAVEMQWQVLWHELMHSFLRHSGNNDAHDESIIEAVSTHINWILMQNGQGMMPVK